MKILAISYLFPNSQYPNYGIFVLNRLKALQKYCDLKVINPIQWFPFLSHFSRYHNYNKIPQYECIQGIDVYHPRFPSIPRYMKSIDSLSYTLAIVALVQRLNKEFNFDLIDLHWTYPDLPAGVLLSSLTGKPFLTTLRGHEAFYLDEPGIRKKIVSYCLQKSSHIIALSRKLLTAAVDSGCNENKIQVIRNGVDGRKFAHIPKAEARAHLGLPADVRIILSVGSLIYGKGFDRIIAALKKRITILYPDVRLYLAGSEGAAGCYKKELMQQIDQFNLQKHVFFTGEIKNTDLMHWYNAADLFCLASRREGSPNVLTEALCCGCPAVATDVGSVADIMSENHLGFVVPNQDNILEGLLLGLGTSFDRQSIARHMSKYDWDWCAQQVISVYQHVLNKESE